jgi:hypothetical protein
LHNITPSHEVFVSQASVPHEGTTRQYRRGNNRATVRYSCAPATIGRLFFGEEEQYQHAWVVNLSCQGVGLVLPRPVTIDTPIIVQMRSADSTTLHELQARVAHCTAHTFGDWMIGCAFDDPLSTELLDNLL